MTVNGCLKDTAIELLLFLVFILLLWTLIILFVFIYCISFSHPATWFNKLELS